MKLNEQLLKELSHCPGISGHEAPVRQYIKTKLNGICDSYTTDNLGNLIAIKQGTLELMPRKKIMLSAHMDEIGFIVKHIDEKGFIRFHTIGGFDPKTLTSMRVIVHGKKDFIGVMGSKPIHVMTPEERTKSPKNEDYYIDLGLPKEEIEGQITIGDPITRHQEFTKIGNCYNGKSLDNRLSVFILLEALRTLEKSPFDVYAVFSVQEEVGLRGASVAAHTINPDFGIAIDVTIANDTPGASPQDYVTELGKGTAIKVFDSSTICDYRMVKYLRKIATQEDITFQNEILTAGGTDTAGLQRMGKDGSIAGAISIPLRYVHQTTEMAHQTDIENSIKLLKAAIENLDQYDWSHE